MAGPPGDDWADRRRNAAAVSVRTVRRIVLGVCAAGIAGMIVSSIRASTAGALTFGLVTAAAVLCLIVATAVAGGGLVAGPPGEAAGDEHRGGG